MLPWVGFGIRLVAAGIWLFAGVTKLADLDHFHAQVQAYELLPGLVERPFAYGLALLEVAIGLYLLLGLLVRPVAILTCVLMAAFLVAQAQAWARGLSLDCGCFGTVASSQVGVWTMLRDAALGVPGLVLAIRPARKLSLDHSLLGLEDAFERRTPAAAPAAEPSA